MQMSLAPNQLDLYNWFCGDPRTVVRSHALLSSTCGGLPTLLQRNEHWYRVWWDRLDDQDVLVLDALLTSRIPLATSTCANVLDLHLSERTPMCTGDEHVQVCGQILTMRQDLQHPPGGCR